MLMSFRSAILGSLTAVLLGCGAVPTKPAFQSLSIDVRYDGSGGANRSISADGHVFGMHASGSGSGLPVISESREQARQEDLVEIARLVRDLPESGEIPAPADPRTSVIILEVGFADNSVRKYYRPMDRDFQDQRLLRLQKILYSYRAGYW